MAVNHEPLWTKNFIILTISNTFLFSGFHIFLPTLPLYVIKQGGSGTDVGLLSGIFVFFAIVIRFFTDYGIEKFGKKFYLILGIVLCFVAALSYIMATTVPRLLSLRVIHGIGFGIATTLYATIVSDLLPQSRRGEGMGYFGLGTTLAMAVAPAVGVWIVDNYSFTSLFVIATVSQIIALLCMSFYSHSAQEQVTYRNAEKTSIVDKLIEKHLIFQSFLTILFGVCVGGILNFIALLAQEVHIANAGYFFLVCTLCIFIARLVTGKIFDRKGPAWVIMPGAALLLLGYIVLAQTKDMDSFLLAAILYGFGFGTIFPAMQTWMFNIVPADKRSAASATFYNMVDIGNGAGSILLGMLAAKSGYASIYWSSAIITGLFMFSYVWFIMTHKQRAVTTAGSEEARS